MARPAHIVVIGSACESEAALIRQQAQQLLPQSLFLGFATLDAFFQSDLVRDGSPIDIVCLEYSQVTQDPQVAHFKQLLNADSKLIATTLAFNVPVTSKQDYVEQGMDFIINSAVSEACWLSVVQGALGAAKAKRRLFAEVKEASDIALLAMETSSFLGEVIKFLEFSFACKTLEELFKTVQLCVSRMNLNCSAVMEWDGDLRHFSTDENRLQLEFMLANRGEKRITDNNEYTLFSFSLLSLMVYPMPVNEVDRYGQLKDVLVMLANGANARVHGINMEHKALRAHETKSAFLAKISHELRTPLNAIIGFSRLLQRKKPEDVYSQRDLDAMSAINSNGHHLLSMVTDLLDFAQLDVGGLTLARSHCDVVPILSKVVEGYRFWADEKKIELYPVTSENGLIAVVDPARLEQAIRNIVANAIKYTEQGFVRASVERTVDARLGACFSIVVRDSGVGISDENYKQIVQMFTRPHATPVRSLEGVGMGLSMAAALVELHHGMISLDRHPEGGCSFTITVPFNPVLTRSIEPATFIKNSDIELF